MWGGRQGWKAGMRAQSLRASRSEDKEGRSWARRGRKIKTKVTVLERAGTLRQPYI